MTVDDWILGGQYFCLFLLVAVVPVCAIRRFVIDFLRG